MRVQPVLPINYIDGMCYWPYICRLPNKRSSNILLTHEIFKKLPSLSIHWYGSSQNGTHMGIGSKEMHILLSEVWMMRPGKSPLVYWMSHKVLSNSLRQSLLAVLVCPRLCLLLGKNKGPMQDIWISNYWSKRANGCYLLPLLLLGQSMRWWLGSKN